MSPTVQLFVDAYKFNRDRTLGLLDKACQQADPQQALSWRPGPGRAHIGWQLMHIGITEEIFATERLNPQRPPAFADLWPRFRGGSTPDDQAPTADELRRVLNESRAHLVETLSAYRDDRLGEIPPAMAARKLTVRDILALIAWHEAHHQGQAHITLNLYLATLAKV
ncbi:MAG TPA: DinB family protein [Pirellulales bacterium]|nr:DinB family protein [Pirellulales bacterium]